MTPLKWSNHYSVYIPELDAEHRTLFRIAQELHRAVTGDAAASEAVRLLEELSANTSRHFLHEERLMRATGCPSYLWHQRQHRAALRKVRQLDRRFRSGDREALRLLWEFVTGWMKDHTRLSDRIMSAYLRNYERLNAQKAS